MRCMRACVFSATATWKKVRAFSMIDGQTFYIVRVVCCYGFFFGKMRFARNATTGCLRIATQDAVACLQLPAADDCCYTGYLRWVLYLAYLCKETSYTKIKNTT